MFPKRIPPASQRRFLRLRLAWMMFLQYFILGSNLPIFSLYLKDHLGFTGSQIGIVMSMSSVAALVAPFVGACIADRIIGARILLGICHLCAAIMMGILAMQRQFTHVVTLYLLYVLVIGPTIPLTNAIVFHHYKEKNQQFGNIRVFGTLGWIAVSWLFGYWWLGNNGLAPLGDRLPDALKLSAISSSILGFYAFTLPRGSLKNNEPIRIIPLESIRVLFQPQVLFLALASLIIGIVDRYYYFGAGPFLRHFGFSDGSIMPAMSLGQIVEVVAMSLLSFLLARLGVKLTLILGVLAEVWRFVALSLGSSTWMIISGIACHGVAYALFFTTVYITIDSYAEEKSRTGLHQLLAIITSGLGSMSANLLAGICLDNFVIQPPNETAEYGTFWLIPAVLSAVVLLALLIFFRVGQKPERTKPLDDCSACG